MQADLAQILTVLSDEETPATAFKWQDTGMDFHYQTMADTGNEAAMIDFLYEFNAALPDSKVKMMKVTHVKVNSTPLNQPHMVVFHLNLNELLISFEGDEDVIHGNQHIHSD